jgi:hypothetical protein
MPIMDIYPNATNKVLSMIQVPLKRRGFADLISEYNYVKRILYVEIPILIAAI